MSQGQAGIQFFLWSPDYALRYKYCQNTKYWSSQIALKPIYVNFLASIRDLQETINERTSCGCQSKITRAPKVLELSQGRQICLAQISKGLATVFSRKATGFLRLANFLGTDILILIRKNNSLENGKMRLSVGISLEQLVRLPCNKTLMKPLTRARKQVASSHPGQAYSSTEQLTFHSHLPRQESKQVIC